MYFNCGFLSGASIPHKHMQLIPYSSLYGSLLPVENAALTIEGKEKMFHLPHFKQIKHVFYDLKQVGFDCLLTDLLPEEKEEYFEHQASLVETCYTQCLNYLGYKYSHEKSNHQDYNLILTRNFLLLIFRSRESVKHPENSKADISMNSLGFVGTMAVKNEESLEYIKQLTPIGVLERLSMTAE